MSSGRFIGLVLGATISLCPTYSFAQGNPWLVPTQDQYRSEETHFSERSSYPPQGYGNYDNRTAYPQQIRPRNEQYYGPYPSDRSAPRAPADTNRYQSQDSSTWWTSTPPAPVPVQNQYENRGQPAPTDQLYYRRQGRFIPTHAIGRFYARPQQQNSAAMQYPPPGYDPSRIYRPSTGTRNSQRREYRAEYRRPSYAQPHWPQQQYHPEGYALPQQAWPQRVSPQSVYSQVNPIWNTNSPGFAGPSTFGNPFGSPFGGMSGPYGLMNAPGLPQAGMW